jgi:hypothetical protein
VPSSYAKKKQQQKELGIEPVVVPVLVGDDDNDVRAVPPSRAMKTYRCPGCDQEIWPKVSHVVVVPRAAPDLRRHWHRACWLAKDRRR